jgi:hypothetical protein
MIWVAYGTRTEDIGKRAPRPLKVSAHMGGSSVIIKKGERGLGGKLSEKI